MRIAIGQVYHESSTFCSQPTTLEKFREKDLHFGSEIISHWTGTSSELGGFIEAGRQFRFEIVPTLAAWAVPAGPLTEDAFETISEFLCSRLAKEKALDGVLLSLHGSMVANSFPDADGELLRRVRHVIGSNTPLVVTLDFHSNVTKEMVRWPDAMIGYDTYPHVDQVERGMEAARILEAILKQNLKPKMALARRPLFPHILKQFTERGPMSEAMALAHEIEQQPGMISVSVAAGFAYQDVPETGFSVYAVAQDDANLAMRAAEQVAEFVWQRRIDFQMELPLADAAVAEALAQPSGLTILVDVGDNLGAGTPADGTILLAELLKQKASGTLVLLCDPEAVSAAIEAGPREPIRLKVGGKVDDLHGSPIEIEGVVRVLTDGIFKNIGLMRNGVIDDQGRTAVIDTGGVLVVLTERRMPMWNLQQIRALGIEPTGLRIIVVKAAIAYRAAYEPIAQHIIEVDTPGLSAADVRRFNYKRIERPLYPLDSF